MEEKNNLLTEGVIWKKIVSFAVPLFLGNLFQQLYNTVDSLVVGNYIGEDALAAVGSSGSIIFLLVGFINGIFIGAGVVISRYFGARDTERVNLAVHTSVAFGVIASVLLTVIGVGLTPQILRWMSTPESVMPNSVVYFRIYFSGIFSVVFYNVANGIFQAMGDSRHPLYYLIISSVTNVILDLLFVRVFHTGVEGVAFATILSQTLSAFLGFYRLCHLQGEGRVSFRQVRIDPKMLKEILHMGLPSGVQNSVISLANIVVQSNINVFGASAVAGCGSYSKIEGFGFLFITCFAMSMTTFTSQNLGAGKLDRVRKGAKFGIFTCLILAETVGILIYVLIPLFMSAFSDVPEVISYGVRQARTVSLFYFLLAFSHCQAGIMRGAGKSIVPMLVMLGCWCLLRITYISIAVQQLPQIETIFWAYPITWTCSSLIFLCYYFKGNWLRERTQKKA